MKEPQTGFGLSGRAAIVTGAASGIGRAAAARLAEAGASVLAADRNEAGAEALVAEIAAAGGTARVCHVDMADPASVEAMVADAVARFGRLDILVNNAAIGVDHDAPFTLSALHKVFAVNLDGALHAALTAAPHLANSDQARIVNMASVQSFRGYPGSLAYGSAKGALANATRILACDLAPQGIRVNAVAPGFIDTPMSHYADGTSEHETEWFQEVYVKHGRIPLRRGAKPEEVAGPILFLCSAAASYVTGQILVVDGGLTATF